MEGVLQWVSQEGKRTRRRTFKTLVIHPKDKSTDFLKVIYAGRDDFTVITEGTKEEVNTAIKEHDHIIMMGHGTPQGLFSVGQFDKPKPKPTPKPSTAIRSTGKPVTGKDIKDFYGTGKDDGIRTYSSYGSGSSRNLWDDDEFGFAPTKSYGSSFQSMFSSYIIDDKTVELLKGKKLTTIWCNADQFVEWNGLGGFYTGMFISEPAEATLIGTAGAEQWQVDESNYGFVSVVRRFIDQSPEVLHAAVKLEYGKMAEYNPVARYNYRRLYTREEGNAELEQEKSGAVTGRGDKAGRPSLKSA